MSLLSELKRRNVLRVAAAYVVTAWLIVQVVETLFPIYGLSDAAMRLVVNVLAIGLLPVLVLSWVFEWTPEGIKRDADLDSQPHVSQASTRTLDRIILAVLALALGYFAFDKFVLAPQQQAEEVAEAREEGRSEAFLESFDQSIAVLAFDDMSQLGDQEYLSDGLAEEILHLLEKIDGLRVISRTSAFAYKGKDTPITTIAEQLNVAHVLEGSVRKSGDRIRVTAQLIDGRTDTHLWSQTYDRTLDDIFAIQDELAAAMVDQLQIELLGAAPTQQRVDPEAYLLWLEGHSLVAYRDAEKAALLLEQAVAIEPEFADAWADLSRAYYQLSPTFGQKNNEGDEFLFKAEAAWAHLESLESEHPLLLAGDGWEMAGEKGDFVAAAPIFERAIEQHHGHWDVIRMAGFYSSWIRRDDVALAILRPFVERDPLCTDCSYRYARAAMWAGEYEESVNEIRRFRALLPDLGGEITLATSLLMMGDIEGVRGVIRRTEESARGSEFETDRLARALFLDLMVRLNQGEAAESAREDIARLDAMQGENVSITDIDMAEVLAMAGRTEEAFDRLAGVKATYQPFRIASFTRSPFLTPLHGDPRWLSLLEAGGVAPDQLAEIQFDPQIPGVSSRSSGN